MVDDSRDDPTPIINLEVLTQFISFYKVPVFFGLIGIILLTSAVLMLWKNQTEKPSVVFTTESTASAAKKIKVDIEGEVMTPGVYTLSEGERIIDALIAAGGLSEKADRDFISKNLNKAAKLIDGSKIYIPATSELTRSNLGLPAGITSKTININSASQSELEALPGVGPVTAGKIITGRPYQSLDELKSKKIIGTALFEKLKDLLSTY